MDEIISRGVEELKLKYKSKQNNNVLQQKKKAGSYQHERGGIEIGEALYEIKILKRKLTRREEMIALLQKGINLDSIVQIQLKLGVVGSEGEDIGEGNNRATIIAKEEENRTLVLLDEIDGMKEVVSNLNLESISLQRKQEREIAKYKEKINHLEMYAIGYEDRIKELEREKAGVNAALALNTHSIEQLMVRFDETNNLLLESKAQFSRVCVCLPSLHLCCCCVCVCVV